MEGIFRHVRSRRVDEPEQHPSLPPSHHSSIQHTRPVLPYVRTGTMYYLGRNEPHRRRHKGLRERGGDGIGGRPPWQQQLEQSILAVCLDDGYNDGLTVFFALAKKVA